MCGIFGMIGYNEHALSPETIHRVLASLHHRGPDGQQLWQDVGVVLGHTRLRIIDISESANQPMISACGRYVLVFNGEIYNYLELRDRLRTSYEFRTRSDSEVLLAGYVVWGERVLDELIGMFSFAVWDTQSQSLLAARDRFGVKPFYYSTLKAGIVFASEIKALWSAGVDRMPEETVWASFLTYGDYGHPDETFWQGIRQLPAGHCMTWNDGNLEIKRWYDLVERVLNTVVPNDYRIAGKQWLNLATDSVHLRFRSDVPVGFNLSGGLDSSLLLGLVHRLQGRDPGIEAYHFFTGDSRYDELPWVQDMTAHTGFPLNAVRLHAEDVPDLARQTAMYMDEPYGGLPTIAYSLLFREARKHGTFVLLDGQGVDEALAGYDYYARQDNLALVQGTLSSPVRPEVLTTSFRELARKPEYPRPFGEPVRDMQYRDICHTKIPRALRFNDRISMMHGTELREPFLDHRLVEFGLALPVDFKIRDGQGKWLVREVAGQLIPSAVAIAPKRPLQTPQREWLAHELAAWVNEGTAKLLDGSSRSWFDPESIRTERERFFTHGQDSSFWLWQWMDAAEFLN